MRVNNARKKYFWVNYPFKFLLNSHVSALKAQILPAANATTLWKHMVGHALLHKSVMI